MSIVSASSFLGGLRSASQSTPGCLLPFTVTGSVTVSRVSIFANPREAKLVLWEVL